MERICKDSLDDVPPELMRDLIKAATDEMLSSKEVLPEWQGAASNLLVALGAKYCNDVMELLFNRFQPGVVPHFFIIQTMGNLATENVYGTVPFLKGTLGMIVPVLGGVKHDNMKWVFAFALAKFSECILEYLVNIEDAPDTNVKKEVYATEITIAYEILVSSWLQSKEAKIRLVIMEAVGHMSHLMSHDKLEEQVPKILPVIMTLYKRHPPQEHYHITQGLCMLLDAAVKSSCPALELKVDTVLNMLFTLVCVSPDYSQPMTIKNQNELLRCFEVTG